MTRHHRTNLLLRTNTSGLPGIRLNRRKGYLVVDVTWCRPDGSRGSTSYPADRQPVQAVERAMHTRWVEAGAVYTVTARQAWNRLRAAAPRGVLK